MRQRRHRLGAAHRPRGRDEPGPARRLPREPVGGDRDLRRAVLPDRGQQAGRAIRRAQTPGPFSAIDSATAAFIDWCSACGYGTASWDIAASSGTDLAKKGNVGAITYPQAASFLSATAGWVAGTETVYPASGTGKTKAQERIVATADGGRTWHVQYAGPWITG